jgi:hypothetical protein
LAQGATANWELTMATDQSMSQKLTDDEARGLLVPHESVRDPVQGDIPITALERVIIDTQSFQRLRRLKQLGPTSLVYPGAVHTRFEHSLGTVAKAEELVRIANRNHQIYEQPGLVRIEAYPRLLVRLYALLHDVAHMPFGHTLEDEGNLAPPEWDDKNRVDMWLGDSSEIVLAVRQFLIQSGISPQKARQLLDDVRRYTTHDGDPMPLEFPYVADIVGNTICADLLDYVERDHYFCGLKERCGDRFIRYLAVMSLSEATTEDEKKEGLRSYKEDAKNGKGRVVVLAYRFEQGHGPRAGLKTVPKPEILSEVMDLLRRRYALAEKVFFHRTKIAASAMLISATGRAKDHNWLAAYGQSDEEFVSDLTRNGDSGCSALAEAYRRRKLPQVLYRVPYRPERDFDEESIKLWGSIYPKLRNPIERVRLEREIERYAGLKPGSVIIYCPDRRMNVKRYEVLVQARPEAGVKPLRALLDGTRRQEMDVLNEKFKELWNLLVLVDPELDVSQVADSRVQDLSSLCEALIDFPNAIEGLQTRGRPLRDQIAARVAHEYQEETGSQVTLDVLEELIGVQQREGQYDLMDAMRRYLHSRVAGPDK